MPTERVLGSEGCPKKAPDNLFSPFPLARSIMMVPTGKAVKHPHAVWKALGIVGVFSTILILLANSALAVPTMPEKGVVANTSGEIHINDDQPFKYCPALGSTPHETVDKCSISGGYTQKVGSDTFVVIGANTSSPLNFTVADSAHDHYTFLANHTNDSSSQGIWMFVAKDVSGISSGTFWVNSTVSTRYVFEMLHLINASDVDYVSSVVSDDNMTVWQSLKTVGSSDAEILVAFDNQTLADTACSYDGMLIINSNWLTEAKDTTYRNLVFAYTLEVPPGTYNISMTLGNYLNQAGTACGDNDSNYVAYAVAFEDE